MDHSRPVRKCKVIDVSEERWGSRRQTGAKIQAPLFPFILNGNGSTRGLETSSVTRSTYQKLSFVYNRNDALLLSDILLIRSI